MATQHILKSDIEIVDMIEQGNPLGWQYLYDKYALMMYVAILWVVDEGPPAEEILVMLFFQLKADKSLLETKKSLCQSLLFHTCVTSLKIMQNNEIVAKREDDYHELFAMSA